MNRVQRFGLLILILLAGFWLRLYLLDGQSLWWDEGISLHLATSSFAEIVADRITNIHPPLYFFLLKLWVTLTGTSVFAARYSSVLGSFLQMALVYVVLRRWFGRGTAAIGLVLTAVWAMSIIYAQEVRVYAFLPLVYLLLLLLTWEIGVGQPNRQTWLALGMVEWLALHLHYNSLFLLIFLNGWLLVKLWRRPELWTWLKVQMVAGLASLPWAIGVLLNWSAVQAEANLAGFSTQPPAWDFVLPQVWGFHLTGLVNVLDNLLVRPLSGALLTLLVLLILGQWWTAWRHGEDPSPGKNRWTGRLLLFWLGPLLLGFYVWLVRSYSHPRYIALFAAGFVLLLAYLLTPPIQERKRWVVLGNLLRMSTAVCFIWLSGWGLQHYFFDPAFAKDDMRALAALLEEMAMPDDLILLPDAGYAFQFEYSGKTPLVMPQLAQPKALWRHLGDWSAQPRRLFRVMDEADSTATAGEIPFALESGGWLVRQVDFDGLRLAVYQLESAINRPEMQPKTAQFGPLKLTGAWIEQGAAADTAVSIALAWQKTAGDEDPYHAALRLVDMDGLPLAQRDELLLDEMGHPAGAWPLGEPVVTYHRLPIAPGTPPLTFAVDLSVYRLTEAGIETVNRLDQPGQQVILGETMLTSPVGVDNPYRLAETLPPLPTPVSFADRLTLLAAGIDRQEIAPGQSLLVALKWQSMQADLADYWPRLMLLQAGEVLAELAAAPALGRYPTSLWQPGEIVVEHRFLPIPAAAEGVAQLVVELEGEQLVLSEVTIATTARQFTSPPIDVPINESLADLAVLVGYDLAQNEIAADESLMLTLVWQATSANVDTNYTVFVHLLDADGRLIGQHDGQPVNDRRPTTGWVQGEYLVDLHEIRVKEPTFTGEANLVVGLYDPVTGDRLLTADGHDFIRLNTAVHIVKPDE